MKFQEMVQDIKPDIVSATAACEELRKSKKFSTILKLVLVIGNYMAAGSTFGQAIGFEISYLPKLKSTKAADNKTTLLHFLVQQVEEEHPDCLNFWEEIHHVDRASRVSPEQLQKNLSSMKKSINQLEMDLKNFRPYNHSDRFGDAMVKFLDDAKEKFQVLEQMFSKMDRLFKEIAQYYVFDPKKYTLDDFFGDMKSFKDQFIEAYKEILKQREQEEKMQRAKEAKEKAEQEKRERQSKKLKLVDINKEQEGVMDSLLAALETGSAFAQPKRKRQTRAPNNNGKFVISLYSIICFTNCFDHLIY